MLGKISKTLQARLIRLVVMVLPNRGLIRVLKLSVNQTKHHENEQHI